MSAQKDTQQIQDSAMLCSMRLLADLFAEKSEKENILAKLWETDPQKYGTDTEGIAFQKGRSEVWGRASEMLKNQTH